VNSLMGVKYLQEQQESQILSAVMLQDLSGASPLHPTESQRLRV
jgi:hypothetical protein